MIRYLYNELQKRRRLQVHSRVETEGLDYLTRYVDPETGLYWVGIFRYDPALIPSILNAYDDLQEELER